MGLPISIPYTFASAVGTAQLSQLDADFALLASTVNGIGNGSVPLANVQITGGSWSGSPIGISGGGTGLTTLPANNQILIGSSGAYTLANLVAGTNVSITNAGGNVTISSTGGGGTGVSGVYQPSGLTSAAIQTAINTAAASGGGTVALAPGTYVCTSQIVVSGNVHLVGLGEYLFNNNTNPSTGQAYGLSGGAILSIQWGSGSGHAGTTTYAAVILKNSSGVKNIAFDYPGQSPSASTPTEYGSTIQISDNPCWNQYVTDCFFNKSYVGIDFRGSKCYPLTSGIGGAVIQRNSGCPLNIGIAIDFMVDWCNITDNHFNSGLSYPSQSMAGVGLPYYAQLYGTALYLGGCDWAHIINMQAWGYVSGVQIAGQAGYSVGGGGKGPYQFSNCHFDACWTGIYISGVCMNVSVDNGVMCPYKPYTSIPGAAVSIAPSTTLSGFSFTNNYVFGPVNNAVWFGQSSQTVSNCVISNNVCTTSSGGQPAVVFVNGSNIDVVSNMFTGFSATTSFGSATNAIEMFTNGTTSGLLPSSGASGNVLTSNGSSWVSQATNIAIGTTTITGGSGGNLFIDNSGVVAETNTFTMTGIIGSVAGSGSRWTGASVFGASTSNWGVEATQNSSSSTGNGALVCRVNNTSNPLAGLYYTTTNVGSITTNGSGTTYGTSSDYRLKENVQNASGWLATVKAMRPVSYTWIGNAAAGTDTGFIAHELQAVVPQAVVGVKDGVTPEGEIIPQQVDYSRLVPHLVAAIQELSAQVDELKSKIPGA